jgi:hypothetical protein
MFSDTALLIPFGNPTQQNSGGFDLSFSLINQLSQTIWIKATTVTGKIATM